jgi:glyoxylase-like metal-dependent hydrolase (beta-lactamase superfamily II)
VRIRQHGFIYQLTFLPSLFPVNCYLVEEEKELTLIDAALPYSHKKILQTAKKIGKPITRIVLTHAHEDHVGALDYLKKALPKAEVMISKRDAKILKGDRTLESSEPQTPIRGGIPKSLQTRLAVAGKVKPLFPFPAFGTWNKEIALESARKLRDLNPSLLAVGHGPMLINPVEAMSKAINNAEKSLERRGNR